MENYEERYNREACCGECGRVFKRIGHLPRVTITRVVPSAPLSHYGIETAKHATYDTIAHNVDDRALAELAAGAECVYTRNKRTGNAIALRPFPYQGETLYAVAWDVTERTVPAREAALARVAAAFTPGETVNVAERWKQLFPPPPANLMWEPQRWVPPPLADHPGFRVELDDGIGWESDDDRRNGSFTVSLHGCPAMLAAHNTDTSFWLLTSLCEVYFERR